MRMGIADVYRYVSQPDPQTKIWRYMDFTKYVSLLQSSKLFFPQMSQLEDKYEGSLTAIEPEDLARSDNLAGMLQPVSQQYRDVSAVTCWHMNKGESAALWKLYLSNNEGIAIQTTVQRLLTSLRRPPFMTGKVIYNRPGDWQTGGGAIIDGRVALLITRP